jgi:GNAT superfamily N-acetyltransferase
MTEAAEELPPSVEPARIVVRVATPRDVPFVASSWIRSYRKAAGRMDPRVYTYWHHRVLEALIPQSVGLVACDEADPDRIYGYGFASFDGGAMLTVHYVYVRGGFRGQGIGSAILDEWVRRFKPTSVVWTHETDAGRDFARHHLRLRPDVAGVYNPYVGLLQWARQERKG